MNETSKNLYNLLISKDFDVETFLAPSKKAEPDPNKANMFSFEYSSNGNNYGNVVLLLNSENELQIFVSESIRNDMKYKDKNNWKAFTKQLKSFAMRNRMGFKFENLSKLGSHLQTMASSVNESYYGSKKTSYSPQANARIVIKHSKPIGETDKRYYNIKSIFIENENGERFKLPFNKLAGARAMARHVTEGGNPYDEFGQHIIEMVNDVGIMGGFMRRSKMFEDDEEVLSLVETGRNYYNNTRKNIKSLSSKKGYKSYKENWVPDNLIEDEDLSDIRQKFTKEAKNDKVQAALPLLNKLQRKEQLEHKSLFAKLSKDLFQMNEDYETYAIKLSSGKYAQTYTKDPLWSISKNKMIKINESKYRGTGVVVPVKLKNNIIKENYTHELREFNSWASNMVEDSSTDMSKDQVQELAEWFIIEQPVGISALNASASLDDILSNPDLSNELSRFAEQQPDGDARPIVLDWIRGYIDTHSDNKSNILDIYYDQFENAIASNSMSESKDLDTDEQCCSQGQDDKITNKGKGMDKFKEYTIQKEEVKTSKSTGSKVTESKDYIKEDIYFTDEDFSSLIKRTNFLLQQ